MISWEYHARDMLPKDNITDYCKVLSSLKSLPAFLGIIRLDYKHCHSHWSKSKNNQLEEKCDFAL